MSFVQRNYLPTIALLLAGSGFLRAQDLTITSDHADGIYKIGEVIKWQITWSGTNATNTLKYSIKNGGLTEVAGGTLKLTNGLAMLTAKLDQSGTLLAEVRSGTDRRQRALAGAVAAPDKIKPAGTRPADFDSFWKGKLEELATIQANPKLETGEAGKPGLDYWKITMDNIRGTHIQGQLARPKEGEKFPALLIVQWAGVYPLQKSWAVDRAAKGWLTLNIEAHDLPIDQPKSFYDEQSAGPLKNYPAIGNDDRETSYFLRMYLSCYRAAQYLADRPDWDGKTLVVMGDSQGGQQTLVTAGLHPKITAALALVPAGCDFLGPDAGRKDGWPQWYAQTAGKDAAKVHATSQYFDAAHFAPRIKCPILVGLGLIDETCPPASVLAAVNQTPGSKEVIILPKAGHLEVKDSQGAFKRRKENDWLPALVQGKPAPVANEKTGAK